MSNGPTKPNSPAAPAPRAQTPVSPAVAHAPRGATIAMPTTAAGAASAKPPPSPAPKLSALAEAHERGPALSAPSLARAQQAQAPRANKPGSQPLANTGVSQPLALSLSDRDHLPSSMPAAQTQRSPMIWLAIGVIVIAALAIAWLLNRREPTAAPSAEPTAVPAVVPEGRTEAQPAATSPTPAPTPSAVPAAPPTQPAVQAVAPTEQPQAAEPKDKEPRTSARSTKRPKQRVRVQPVDGPVLLVKPSRTPVTEDDDELKAAARAAARLADEESGSPPPPPSPDGE